MSSWSRFQQYSTQSQARTRPEVSTRFYHTTLDMRYSCSSSDLHKIYYDDESHNKGHGHAYEYLGIDPQQGALIIVRPDQCTFPHFDPLASLDT
jgi:hypothetical protein